MMFLPAVGRFCQHNVFQTITNHGTKDLMQDTEYDDDPDTVQEEEQQQATAHSRERTEVVVNQNQSSSAPDQSSRPPFDPTPLGNYGIRVVGEVSLAEFSVPNEEFNDWIGLLRGDKESEEMGRVPFPVGGAASSLSSSMAHDPDDDSPEDSKPPAKGSAVVPASKSQRPELQIKDHHKDQWNERFAELVEYHQTFGHTHVPYHYKKSPPLAWWVKRQRHQYKMKQDGHHSTLTDDREKKLEDLGFCWDSHTAVWEERLDEFIDHKRQHGETAISQTNNPKLLIWVKCQRRQFKLYCNGEKSSMTPERIDKLNAAGFCWNPRRGSSEARRDGAHK